MVVRNGAQQTDVMMRARADDGLGRPDIESGRHAGEKGVIALRNGVFDRAVERRLERLHGVRVVCAEGPLLGPVPGKATGMAARILHISTSEAEWSQEWHLLP